METTHAHLQTATERRVGQLVIEIKTGQRWRVTGFCRLHENAEGRKWLIHSSPEKATAVSVYAVCGAFMRLDEVEFLDECVVNGASEYADGDSYELGVNSYYSLYHHCLIGIHENNQDHHRCHPSHPTVHPIHVWIGSGNSYQMLWNGLGVV